MQCGANSLNRNDSEQYWIDALRAIGIFFVVLGHTPGLEEPTSYLERSLSKYIFSFHMPMFFFLSGYLISEGSMSESFFTFAGKYFKRLIIPYLFFGVLSYLFWFFVLRHYGRNQTNPVTWMRPLVGIFYGNGVNDWLRPNPVLWFLPCLFLTHLLFYWLRKIRQKELPLACLLGVMSIIGFLDITLSPFRLPWSLDIAFTAVVFYGVGFLLRGHRYMPKSSSGMGLFCLLAFAIQIVSISKNCSVNMNWGIYGNYYLFYIGAFSGIFFWFQISQVFPPISLVRKIGKNTMTIYALHILVFAVLKGIFLFIIGVSTVGLNSSLTANLIFATFTVIILLPISSLLQNYAPWAVGKGRVRV